MAFASTTISTIATIASVGSSLIGAVSATQQGNAAAQQAEYAAQLREQQAVSNQQYAEYNATITERQAEIERQRAARERLVAETNEEDFRRQESRLEARRRAQLAGSGALIGTGTPLLQAGDIASEIELQALRIRNAGDVQSTRLLQQSDIFEREAGLLRLSGRNARLTGATEARNLRSSGRNARSSSRFRAGSLLVRAAGQSAPLFEG